MNRHSLSTSSSDVRAGENHSEDFRPRHSDLKGPDAAKNRKFLLKLLLFGVLIAAYINYILPQYNKGYDAALIDKTTRLETVDEPKIVLLGNSNVAFGFDSAMIEEQTGMPVVNMGLHAGAGNAFHEDMAKFNVREGDLYILCHSSFADSDNIPDTMAYWSSLENHYHLWRLIRWKDIPAAAKGFPVYLKKSLALYASGTGNQEIEGVVHNRSSFNEYGDIGLYREGSLDVYTDRVAPPPINDIMVSRINELNAWLTKRGATLLVAGYPVGNGSLTADPEEFMAFQDELERRLDCAVISNYVDYMFDYTYFWDSNLHLNTDGAKIRTEQLIADILRWREKRTDMNMGEDAYADILSDVSLVHITDLHTYLQALEKGKDRYAVLISANGGAGVGLDGSVVEALRALGLEAPLQGQEQAGYLAVALCGEAEAEQLGDQPLEISGVLDPEGRGVTYQITSGGAGGGNASSIRLNGREYAGNEQGISIVVYSMETGRVLDEVSFEGNDGIHGLLFDREDDSVE